MKKPMLPIREFYRSNTDLIMTDQVSLIRVCRNKESVSIHRTTDKIFIEFYKHCSKKITESEFNTAYVEVLGLVQIYDLTAIKH